MNKYLWLIVMGVVIIGGGIGYRVFFLAEEDKPVSTGNVKEITVIAKKDAWRFVPEEIDIMRGDQGGDDRDK